jgi:hypothetical protein
MMTMMMTRMQTKRMESSPTSEPAVVREPEED